jgi:aminoglycoside 2'-N-acetyltransferase I
MPHPPRSRLQLAHTADLDAETLGAARALLDEVFGAGMTDHAWDHALGGMHALAWDARRLVGHASVVQRRLLHGGRALRTGYVEGVAVRADHRRRGHATAMMDALERVIRGAYDLGALGASDVGGRLYASRGWKAWRGRTWALTPGGIVRTADEDGDVYVLEIGVPLELSGELTCDFRDGDLW